MSGRIGLRRRLFRNLDERFVPAFLVIGTLLVMCAGCMHRPVSPVVDPSARLEERRERSVTEDPAVRGETPDGWLAPPVDKPAAPPNSSEGSEDPKGSEISEFVERFKNTSPPKIFQGELAPGARHAVDMQLSGPSGLAGSAQWLGSAEPMKVTITVNSAQIATATPYRIGANRGGAYLKAQTPVGGHATLAITNTSSVSVKVRIMLVATAR